MRYGRYEIADGEASRVGKGAMGIVYAAVDPKLSRKVAIKVLHQKLLHDDQAVQAFFKEATLNASLSHPNILTILDVGEECGEVYIAMEFLEGKPLSKFATPLSRGDIISIGTQIAEALDYAHRSGIVHRDIKPANIMVRHDGHVKITDFGIAKGMAGAGDTLETQTGVIKGTPAYMSPEQAKGDSKNVDGRSDLFSLGVILYELAVGRRPFGGEGKDFAAVFGEIITKTPVQPSKVNVEVDRQLSDVIMKALQKDPAQRYQSGSELADALRACEIQRAPQATRKNRGMVAGASAAAVAAVAVGSYLAIGGKHPRPGEVTAVVPGVAAPAKAAVPAHPDAVSQPTPSAPTPAAPTRIAVTRQQPAPVAGNAVKEPQRETEKGVEETLQPVPVKKENAQAKPEKNEPPPREEQRDFQAQGDRPAIGRSAVGAAATSPEGPVKNSAATMAQFGFLKVGSEPPGAQVYVNGTLKGATPLKLRLNLGKYSVRLARPGYRDVSTSVALEKMAEFPIFEELKPEQ